MKSVKDYVCIVFGSAVYALGTVLFIFPHRLLPGGTGGISVILELLLPFSPGTILMVLNFSLIVLAFVILGKTMAVKTLVGSVFSYATTWRGGDRPVGERDATRVAG